MALPILALAVKTELDVVASRLRARHIAALCGFGIQDQARIATAVSELARNIFNYAESGRIEFGVEYDTKPQALVIRIEDKGPGIAQLDAILTGVHQSQHGLGLGILGACRLMDQCDIDSQPQAGTKIFLKKALPADAPALSAAMIGAFGEQLTMLPTNVALSEARQQNLELVHALDSLKRKQEELQLLAQELKDTNENVVALNLQLEEQASRLQQADRRKDEFLSILSHELRNPIAVTSMAAQMLETPAVTREQATQLGQRIMRQTNHMARLVEDLIDVSRVSRGLVTLRKAPYDLRSAVHGAAEQAGPLIKEKSHTLALSLPAAPFLVSGDETRLIQAIGNLLSNSARYTPHGGHISVALVCKESQVVLEVRDNGIGLDSALLPQLFDLYVQAERCADRQNGGLGLGLALVKSIVELHGGAVTASSPGVGLGSVFTVSLPRLN